MHKAKTTYFIIITMAAIFVGSGCLAASDGLSREKTSSTFSGPVISAEEAKTFSINATIMEIHASASPTSLIVAERTIVIEPYKYGNKIIMPRLVARDGSLVEIQGFEKEDRVIVTGLELKDGTVFAKSVIVQPKD